MNIPILEFGIPLICLILVPLKDEKLKKLAPVPTIPIDQLRARIASFRHINTHTDKSWIYVVGGGSGSGIILLLNNMWLFVLEM